ncbi:MAG: NYN domain-containing protein [bacterium]|nr:NYN domain-containing protein [bacterium]
MSKQQETERNLGNIAMLIDGDNAQHKILEQMVEEVSRYGTLTYRRAYGDWTQVNLAGWRPVMLANAIHAKQQFSNTKGKNATDSALIIDAMDILHSGKVQGFCIVSSDSDYTSLCMRIREEGLFVMGMGHKQTPESLIKACDVFVYVENLIKSDETSQPQVTTDTSPEDHIGLMKLMNSAFDISVREDGWVHLSALGDALRRIDPSFDSRTYGHKTLSLLIKSLPKQFNIKETKKNGPSSTYYVRMIEG